MATFFQWTCRQINSYSQPHMYLLLCSNKSILLLAYFCLKSYLEFWVRFDNFESPQKMYSKFSQMFEFFTRNGHKYTLLCTKCEFLWNESDQLYLLHVSWVGKTTYKWCVFLNQDQGYHGSFQSEKLTRCHFDLKYASAHHSRVKNPELLGSVLRGVNE